MMRQLVVIFILIFHGSLCAQQVADEFYNPTIDHPAYSSGSGSVVCIDEGHHNFHTLNGRYTSFARLLKRDGYQVKAFQGLFEKELLNQCDILVISNALNEVNTEQWVLPNPSAFTPSEIQIVKQWVEAGGSLFLIADHMPFAGAAEELSDAFGFKFTNGFVMLNDGNIPSIFSVKEGTLLSTSITNGMQLSHRVSEVATFTGQAFQIPLEATAILQFADDHTNFLPDTAWRFDNNTKKQSVKGWAQLAYLKLGKGRVVVSGEAAMFSAQLAGPDRRKMGMNAPLAKQNYQLLLNIIHWLDKKYD